LRLKSAEKKEVYRENVILTYFCIYILQLKITIFHVQVFLTYFLF